MKVFFGFVSGSSLRKKTDVNDEDLWVWTLFTYH